MTFAISLKGEKKIYLVVSAPDKLKTSNLDIVRQLVSGNYPVIIVTTNQPCATLVNYYESNGIDTSKIYFIDSITKYALGKVSPDIKNCKFVNNPANITDLGIAITEVLNRSPHEKPCILFDSVSTMLIYIPSLNISKFIHFVTSKLKLLDSPGIFLAADKSLDPVFMSQLITFVDEVIDTEAKPGNEVKVVDVRSAEIQR